MSQKRTEPAFCAPFDQNRCRSCALLPTPYGEQLASKQQRLTAAFAERGFTVAVQPVYGFGDGFRTRNKAKFAVGGTIENPVLGYVRPDKWIEELGDCPLHLSDIEHLIEDVRTEITQRRMNPYSIERDKGELKYVIIKASQSSKEMIVRLVMRSKNQLQQATELLQSVAAVFPTVKVTSINIQPARTAIIEGSEEIPVSAQQTIIERYGDFQFPIGPQSFSQVNTAVAAALYATAERLVGVMRPKLTLDLFSGVGAFSLFASSSSERVLGVELAEGSVANARAAAQMNKISNVEFRTGNVEDFLVGFTEAADLVIVNPPRRGLGARCCELLKEKAGNGILYSSCSPESLLRDAEMLKDAFLPVEAFPFDMFPHTDHLETLVRFERRG